MCVEVVEYEVVVWSTRLLAAKSRVTSTGTTTPRSELCGLLNMLYRPTVNITIIAHITRFLKFISIKVRIIIN